MGYEQDKRYIENGCDQCWKCRNCVGQSPDKPPKRYDYEMSLSDLLDADWHVVSLPQCKVMDRYMTSVYARPCASFVPVNGTEG